MHILCMCQSRGELKEEKMNSIDPLILFMIAVAVLGIAMAYFVVKGEKNK